MKQTSNKILITDETTAIEELNVKEKKIPKNKYLLIFLATVAILLIVFLSFFYWYINSFSKMGNTSAREIITSVRHGISQDPFESSDQINVLILGKDDFNDGEEGSTLTDTIMLASVHESGSIALLPFPRDLWIDPLKTKINALYYYGEKSKEITGPGLVEKTIEEISGQNIDHIVVINIGFLETVIDILGGITIDVSTAFVDDKYPNKDVPPDILPVELRYETISFKSGLQEMKGSMAIKYIRSRQSENESENTDDARSKRQQKVITAIVSKISSRDIILDPSIVGSLYKIWKEDIQTTLSDKELVSIAKDYFGLPASFNSLSIPVQSLEEDGILYNPPIYKYGQWVYVPHDPSWSELQDFIQLNLHQSE